MIETLAELGVTRLSLGGAVVSTRETAAAGARPRRPSKSPMQLDSQNRPACRFRSISSSPRPAKHSTRVARRSRQPHSLSNRTTYPTYGLTFERGTAFWTRGCAVELDGSRRELQREMYALAIDTLTAAGFEHYEVSNFARPGCRSRHNETYWSGDGYFAPDPAPPDTSTACARRTIAARRPTSNASWPASRPWPNARSFRPRRGPASCWSLACGAWKASHAGISANEMAIELDELVAKPLRQVHRAGIAGR